MLNVLWIVLLLLGIVTAGVTGRMPDVSAALIAGGGEAVTLMLTLGGAMCLWSGFLRVADKAGITAGLCRMLSPVMRLLFPGLDAQGETGRAISMNVAANVLGLGNAATPFGLKAMSCLQRENPHPDRATRDMVVFAVLNTASVQLLPTTVAALRAEAGSAAPLQILPAVWVTSLGSAVAAVTVARLCGGRGRR